MRVLVGVLALTLVGACADVDDERAGDAAVWVSRDGVDWARVDAPSLGGPGEQQLTAVGVVDGVLMAIGFTSVDGDRDGAVWTSGDGLDWRLHRDADLGGPGDQLPTAFAQTTHGLMAVGFEEFTEYDHDAAVWISSDGLDWERAPVSPSFGGRGIQLATAVAELDGLIVVAGGDDGNAAIWVSPDAVSWERVTGPFGLGGPGDQIIESITHGGPGLVAVGWDDFDAGVWTSSDGRVWSQVSNPFVFGGEGWQVIHGITFGPHGLVAVGEIGQERGIPFLGGEIERNWDAAVWLSPDGAVWSPVLDAALEGVGAQSMIGISSSGEGLVAAGIDTAGGRFTAGVWVPDGEQGEPDAAVWLSDDDGLSWTKVRHPSFGGEAWQDMLDVVVFGDLLVGVGGDDREADPR